MAVIAAELAGLGYVLRTGGADGADKAFMAGADKCELFLPWPRFNGCSSRFSMPTEDAIKMAEEFHPNWQACNDYARKLHGRNSHIVLGEHLNSPVEFVLCWTPRGSGSGGTGQALRIARAHKIPIYDFGAKGALDKFLDERFPVSIDRDEEQRSYSSTE